MLDAWKAPRNVLPWFLFLHGLSLYRPAAGLGWSCPTSASAKAGNTNLSLV